MSISDALEIAQTISLLPVTASVASLAGCLLCLSRWQWEGGARWEGFPPSLW